MTSKDFKRRAIISEERILVLNSSHVSDNALRYGFLKENIYRLVEAAESTGNCEAKWMKTMSNRIESVGELCTQMHAESTRERDCDENIKEITIDDTGINRWL